MLSIFKFSSNKYQIYQNQEVMMHKSVYTKFTINYSLDSFNHNSFWTLEILKYNTEIYTSISYYGITNLIFQHIVIERLIK